MLRLLGSTDRPAELSLQTLGYAKQLLDWVIVSRDKSKHDQQENLPEAWLAQQANMHHAKCMMQ